MKKKNQVNILALCIGAAGNSNAGILLNRLLFWHGTTAGVEGYGQKMIKNTLREWAADTGLSIMQVRGAVRLLTEKKLIQAEPLLWHGRWSLHVRPLTDVSALAGHAENNTSKCYRQHLKVLALTPSYIHGDSHGDSHGEKKEKNVTPQNGGITSELEIPKTSQEKCGDGSGVQSTGKYQMPKAPNLFKQPKMKMADVAAILKDKPIVEGDPSLGALISLYKKSLAEANGGFVGPVTQKTLGQLKLFHKAAGPDRAFPIAECCFAQWTLFSSHAKVDAGLKTAPEQIHVGFLLANVLAAYQFWKDSAPQSTPAEKSLPKHANTQPKAEQNSPSAIDCNVPPPVDPGDYVPMTLAELNKVV